MEKLKALFICPGMEDQEQQDMSSSLEFHFRKLGAEVIIQPENDCESILYTINHIDPEQYDVLIINSNSNKLGCYSHSILDSLSRNRNTINTPKLLISNKTQHKRNTIINKEIAFSPSELIIQIKQQDSRNPILIKKIIKSLLTNRPTLYISYGNDQGQQSREVIHEFEGYSKNVLPHVEINHDMKLLKTGDSLVDFMNSMKKGSIILLLMNKKYFKSEYCMQELVYILRTLRGKIYPIFLEDGRDFLTRKGYMKILNHWENELTETQDIINNREINGLQKDIILSSNEILYENIIKTIPEFRLYIQSFFTLPIKNYRNQKYLDIFQKIHEDLSNEGYIKIFDDEEHLKETLNTP